MRAIIVIDLDKVDWSDDSEDGSRLMDAIGNQLDRHCEDKKPVPPFAISGLGVKKGAATFAIGNEAETATSLKALFNAADADIYTDAPEFADQVKRLRDALAEAQASCVAAGLI